MRKFLKFITSRLFIFLLLMVLQALFFYVTLRYVQRIAVVAAFSTVTGIVMAVVVFAHDDSPVEYKLSWTLVIVAMSIFGSFLYLVFGGKKKGYANRKHVERYTALQRSFNDSNCPLPASRDSLDPAQRRQAEFIERNSSAKVYSDTSCEYYPLGDLAYGHILEELEKAKRFIFLEFFIYQEGVFWDSILDVLKRKAAQGVDIRLIYDDMGSINTVPRNFWKRLRSMGIKAVSFNRVHALMNPKVNYRDHRKMIVIDGNTVIGGGINLADEYINKCERFGHWKDNVIVMKGRGVWDFTYMFLCQWCFSCPADERLDTSVWNSFMPTEDGQPDGLVQTFGDSPLDSVNVSENVYLQMIASATRYVWIATPYLILDSVMTNAICTAARSGVDVRIITPGIPDKKSVYELTKANYTALLDAGVRIFEYTPGFIHSKMLLCDDIQATVGTANMDYRSFYLHFECASVFYGGSTVKAVKDDFEETFAKCAEVPADYASTVPQRKRLFRLLARMAAPML